MEYVQRVSQVRDLARRYWFDVLVAALAIVAMLQVVLGFGSSGAPQTTLWFCVPAIAILALAVFARRRFPFAGPAVYWLLAAGISFVDPLLIPYANALFPIGMTVAAGDALLSPAITKRVIKQFTRIPRPAPPKELDELTAREQDILLLIAGGLSNAEIGQRLYISETTVKTHVTHILQKLGLRDRVQAVVLAYQAGLFEKRTTAQ